MNVKVQWAEGMKFEASCEGNSLKMDAKGPIGTNTAMTPKELVAAGLGGCTAMDVIALLKKHKQGYKSLVVDLEITTSTSGQPVVFTGATLNFRADGEIDPVILLKAVRLSQTKYCGVSAMLAKAFAINYVVTLNGKTIGDGRADFGGNNV